MMEIQIGRFVKEHIYNIKQMCEQNDSEFKNLINKNYCLNTFNISYSFLKRVSEIEKEDEGIDHLPTTIGYRYWKKPILIINNSEYRVCSQWYAKHKENFLKYLKEKNILLDKYKNEDIQLIAEVSKKMNIKNIILYGSPGVGKTHNTNKLINLIESGMSEKEIFENIQANEATDYVTINFKDRVKFVTFHQSFGYEDFIEGFRPNEDGKIELVDGVFKQLVVDSNEKSIIQKVNNEVQDKLINIRERPTVWKISLGEGGEIKEECFKDNNIRIGWDDYGDLNLLPSIKQRELNDFYNLEIGDIVLAFKNQWEIDGIGIILDNYQYINSFKRYKHQRKVDWIIKNISMDIREYNKNVRLTLSSLYKLSRLSKQDILELIEENIENKEIISTEQQNYYLIIDEINRGNISKIFGELITLIEEDKRDKLEVTLPYSKQSFKIPSNLYIIGTMNSTDKSIALIDIALRRRFTFLKMKPNAELITYEKAKAIFLELNNKIIKKLGEDYQIGHSYFMNIEDEKDLEFVLKYKIEPLLEEYFYGDDDGLKEILRLIENSSDEEEGE